MVTEKEYLGDLSDAQWRLIQRLLPEWSVSGPKPMCRGWLINAILDVTRTGCQWRRLPHDFPKRKTVCNLFWKWRHEGVWQRLHDRLREKVCKSVGKKPSPTAAVVDRQSVRTAEGGRVAGV